MNMRTGRDYRWLVVATAFATACGGASIVGCGGDDNVSVGGDSGTDAASDGGGTDATVADSGADTNTGVDSSSNDSATNDGSTDDGSTDGGTTDGSDGGGGDGGSCNGITACTNTDGGPAEFTSPSGTCGAQCTDTTDDPSCACAYGNGYLCGGNQCVPGNCHTNAQCNGGICGLSTPYTCSPCAATADCTGAKGPGAGYVCSNGQCVMGNCVTSADCSGANAGKLCVNGTCTACTTDTQCIGDTTYGANTICATVGGSMGQCVSSSCTSLATGLETACANNAGDVCCGATGSTTGTCSAGTCCVNSDCPTANGNAQICVNHQCTALTCTVPTTAWYVDPTATASGTGSQQCPLKSITKAIQAIGVANATVNGTVEVTINLVNDDPAANETFPLTIPAHVHIAGASHKLTVAAGANGFVMAGASSSIATLTLDGAGNTAARGVVATTGSATTTYLDHVTIQNFLNQGIAVTAKTGGAGGILTVAAGTSVTGSGTTSARADGVTVSAGTLYVTGGKNGAGAANTDTIAFSSNTQHGIAVGATGQLVVTATAAAALNGTNAPTGQVVALNNYTAGLYISQTPGASVPANSVYGFVSYGATANGIHLTGGSSLKLRSSISLANVGSGVFISSYDSTTAGNSVANMDFGSSAAADPGMNTLQSSATQLRNGASGICLGEPPATGAQVIAQGNTFANTAANGYVDCSQAGAGALTHAKTCAGAVDLGGIGAGITNSFVILNCTLQ